MNKPVSEGERWFIHMRKWVSLWRGSSGTHRIENQEREPGGGGGDQEAPSVLIPGEKQIEQGGYNDLKIGRLERISELIKNPESFNIHEVQQELKNTEP